MPSPHPSRTDPQSARPPSPLDIVDIRKSRARYSVCRRDAEKIQELNNLAPCRPSLLFLPRFKVEYSKKSYPYVSELGFSRFHISDILQPETIACINGMPQTTTLRLNYQGSTVVFDDISEAHLLPANVLTNGRIPHKIIDNDLDRSPHIPPDLITSPVFEHITTLYIEDFDLTDNLAWLRLFPHLEKVEIKKCTYFPVKDLGGKSSPRLQVDSTLSPSLAIPSLPHLRRFEWDRGSIYMIPEFILQCTNLEYLSLIGHRNLNYLPPQLAKLPHLSFLYINDCGFTRIPISPDHSSHNKIKIQWSGYFDKNLNDSNALNLYLSQNPYRTLSYFPQEFFPEFSWIDLFIYHGNLAPCVRAHLAGMVPANLLSGEFINIPDRPELTLPQTLDEIPPNSDRCFERRIREEAMQIYEESPGELARRYVFKQDSLSALDLDRLYWELEHVELEFLAQHVPPDDPLLQHYRLTFAKDLPTHDFHLQSYLNLPDIDSDPDSDLQFLR